MLHLSVVALFATATALLGSIVAASPGPVPLIQRAGPVAIAPSVTANLPPAAVSSLSAYLSSVTADRSFMSVAQVLATVLPSSELNQALANPTAFLNKVGNAQATEAWVKSLPSDIQSYLKSVGSVESSIVRANGGAPASNTPIPINQNGTIIPSYAATSSDTLASATAIPPSSVPSASYSATSSTPVVSSSSAAGPALNPPTIFASRVSLLLGAMLTTGFAAGTALVFSNL